MKKFIITEEEKNRIRGLYEQATPQSTGTTQTISGQARHNEVVDSAEVTLVNCMKKYGYSDGTIEYDNSGNAIKVNINNKMFYNIFKGVKANDIGGYTDEDSMSYGIEMIKNKADFDKVSSVMDCYLGEKGKFIEVIQIYYYNIPKIIEHLKGIYVKI